jgi:hypothetical protein
MFVIETVRNQVTSLDVCLFSININLYHCSCNCICDSCNCICIVFIVCSVPFNACVVLCAVFCLSVMCYFVWCVICVLCLIVVSLPPAKSPFAVKLSNNNKNVLRLRYSICLATVGNLLLSFSYTSFSSVLGRILPDGARVKPGVQTEVLPGLGDMYVEFTQHYKTQW